MCHSAVPQCLRFLIDPNYRIVGMMLSFRGTLVYIEENFTLCQLKRPYFQKSRIFFAFCLCTSVTCVHLTIHQWVEIFFFFFFCLSWICPNRGYNNVKKKKTMIWFCTAQHLFVKVFAEEMQTGIRMLTHIGRICGMCMWQYCVAKEYYFILLFGFGLCFRRTCGYGNMASIVVFIQTVFTHIGEKKKKKILIVALRHYLITT